MTIRPVRPEDTAAVGRIIYEAFKGITARHNFRPDEAASTQRRNVFQTLRRELRQ